MTENYDEDGYWTEDEEEWAEEEQPLPKCNELSKPVKIKEQTMLEELLTDVMIQDRFLEMKYEDYYKNIPESEDTKQLIRYLLFRITNWIERQRGKVIKPSYETRPPYRQILGLLLLQDLVTDVAGEEDPARGMVNFIPCYLKFMCDNKDWLMDYGIRVLENKYPEQMLIQYAKENYHFLPIDNIEGLIKMELSKEAMSKDNNKSKNRMIVVMNLMAESILKDKEEKKRQDVERMKPVETKTKESHELTTDAVQDMLRRLKTRSAYQSKQ